MSDSNCLFCRKLATLDSLPEGELVWRFPHSVAFLGTWQYYHGYCVLVARDHARELFHLSDEVRQAYLEEMCLLARAIESAFHPLKINYELLGNQVPHLHWHLFPRYDADPGKLAPVWLAIDAAERDPIQRQFLMTGREDRLATVAHLRRVLSSLGVVPT